MFLCYCVAWPCGLDLWPFDLESPTHTPIFIILWLSVTELRLLNIWSHFRYLKQSLRMRRVTWPLTGGKNSPHFWNPWPQFAYSLCHFQGATTKIKLCYMRKIAFIPLWRLQRHILGRNDVFWRIFRKNPFRGVGCSELQEPKKALKTSPQMVRKLTYMGIKNPWRERDKIWHSEWRPRRCHPRQCLSRWVKGF